MGAAGLRSFQRQGRVFLLPPILRLSLRLANVPQIRARSPPGSASDLLESPPRLVAPAARHTMGRRRERRLAAVVGWKGGGPAERAGQSDALPGNPRVASTPRHLDRPEHAGAGRTPAREKVPCVSTISRESTRTIGGDAT